jgi:hypothetical protein
MLFVGFMRDDRPYLPIGVVIKIVFCELCVA